MRAVSQGPCRVPSSGPRAARTARRIRRRTKNTMPTAAGRSGAFYPAQRQKHQSMAFNLTLGDRRCSARPRVFGGGGGRECPCPPRERKQGKEARDRNRRGSDSTAAPFRIAIESH
ncbi:hypothetical protein MTO96_011024 [Rhipicephalus appendiculatus]